MTGTGRARALAAAAMLVSLAGPVQAENITVGVFAPAAPFEGTSARVDFATRLAKRVGASIGADGIGRVYGRAIDFAAAVRRGQVQLAVVDATYLAASGGGGTVIAAGMRDGSTTVPWQIVSRSGNGVLDLRGRSVLVPAVGGREDDFLLYAMFAGELPKGFFGRISAAPDVLSAIAAVALGKADAAVVPTGVVLPPSVRRVATLSTASWPVLVAYGTLSDRQRDKLARAAAAFRGDAVISGFRIENGDAVRKLGRRFKAPRRRGPMAIPSIRIASGELIEGRRFQIAQSDARRFAVTPPPPGE